MNAPAWDDAQIHAFVDGELDAGTALRLEADSRIDAALAARIARQRALRDQLRRRFDTVLDESIPQRLHDALAGRTSADSAAPNVTPIGAAGRSRTRPAWSLREWGAIAATLVIGVLLGAMALRGPAGLPMETAGGRLVANGILDAALSTRPSGAAGEDSTVRIGLSFRSGNGEFCRTFALPAGSGGLACRRDGRWAVQLLEAAKTAADGDYRQAGSTLSPAMLGAMDSLAAGEPLTPEQEQQRLGAGWDTAAP